MKIDATTRYKDFVIFEPMLDEGEKKRIKDAAVRHRFGKDGFYSMTLGDMFEVIAGDTRKLTWGVAPDSVFGVYLVQAFADFIEKLIEKLKALTPPSTPDSVRVSQGCIKREFDESVYVFCREYFGLGGFAAVEQLKVADYIMAKKDAYNKAIVDRNMAASIRKGARK